MDKMKKMSLELNMEYMKTKDNPDFNLENFKKQMEKKYNELFTSHESIFKVSISETYNYSRLCAILHLHNQVKNNEISEHDASVKVGQLLVDDFVKPMLDKNK